MGKVDLSEFERLSARDQRRPCKVAAGIEPIKGDDRLQLIAALEQPIDIITNGGIIAWLEKRGVAPISSAALTTHRHRKCKCHA